MRRMAPGKGETMFLEKFYPDQEIGSAYDIPYEKLYELGYRGILFDIDNTLVTHGAPANKKAVALFRRLHAIGFKTMLISNNKEARVKPFADSVSSRYLYKANKPSRKGYLEAMRIMKTTPGTTLFVGDQLFTDVWGAKRTGIFSYLTKPIHPKEEIQIILKRRLEAIVLFFYHRKYRQ